MDEEERAISSLLDDYDATEALEWLSPLDGALDTPVVCAEEPPPEPSLATVAARNAGIDERNRTLPDTERMRAKQTDPNRARNERRLELIHLRRQATKLEGHLDKMRRDDARRWSSFVTAGDFQCSGVVLTPQASLRIVDRLYPSQRSVTQWEDIARDQRTKRLRAETENTRLRMLVNSHVKAANKLRRILMPKRPRNARSFLSACIKGDGSHVQATPLPVSDGATHSSVGTPSAVLTPATITAIFPSPASFTGGAGLPSSQIFEMLKDSVTCARRAMDALFIANGLAATEKTFRSAKVEQHDAQRATMELAASKVLPYDLESTRRVAWRHFVDLHPRMPDRTSFQYRDDRKYVEFSGVDDMLAASYSYELGNGFMSGKFDEWRVIRQFVEPDRVIIIYCIVSETSEFASKPVSGIQIMKEVYVLLRRPRGDGGDRGSCGRTTGSTLMQSFYRFQPVQYKTIPGLENTFAAVTDFMFGFIGGRISLNYQMIEQELQATAGR